VILDQPKYGHGMFNPGGWTLTEIQKHFKNMLGNKLESIGLTKPPYAYYKGVLPQTEEKK
jgi:hypothetical protein